MSLFNNLSSLFGQPEAESTGKKPPQSQVKTAQPGQKPQRKRFKRPRRQARGGQPATRPPFASAGPSPQQRAQLENIEQEIRESQAKAREIIVEAKAQALSLRSQAEKEARELSKQVETQQRSLDIKLDRIDQRLEQMDVKETHLDRERAQVQQLQKDLQDTREKILSKLEKVSGMTTDEARAELFSDLERRITKDTAQFIRQKEEQAQAEAEERVKEILIDAMKHGATDYVPEYTISIVQLPSEETKGKIIGKAGRNINAFEHATGVDVDLDVSPTEVRLSCFDPVRREIGRISLERLIKDGRIQPSRIEEVVAKVRKEIEKEMLEAGKQLCHEVGIYNLPIDLMKMMGKFKFRFSYGQNLIAHTLEETKIGIKLASELGVDVTTVKLGCLLHDIGKVSDEEEGSHVELGVKIAKRFGLPQAVIDCIAQHHEDEAFSGPEQMVVYIADAISGARPGARYENYDEYVKRLSQLEDIATAYPGVEQAYAIQAGREIRVLLDPENTKDDDVTALSLKIRDEIKEKVTYPGTVTVNVIRETRAQQVAK